MVGIGQPLRASGQVQGAENLRNYDAAPRISTASRGNGQFAGSAMAGHEQPWQPRSPPVCWQPHNPGNG